MTVNAVVADLLFMKAIDPKIKKYLIEKLILKSETVDLIRLKFCITKM